jgi:predicted O-linked N-acetylglucosamine transferase (SPINDLY family)
MNRQQRRMAVKQTTKLTSRRTLSLSEFDIAAHHFQNGRVFEAESACRAILAGSTRDTHNLHRLGMIAHHFKRHEVAAELLRSAIAADRGNVEAYCSLAVVLKDVGRFEDAVQICRDAIARRPDSAEVYNALGRVFHQKGSLGHAEQAYRHAISLDPKRAAAHFNLGVLLHDSGDVRAAQAAFQEAVRVKPEFVDAHRWNAQALRLQERLDEAAAALRRASTMNPKEPGYYSDLAIIYMKQGRFLDAIETCKKALSLKPDDAGSLSNLGNCLHELGRSDEAISAYGLAIKTDPRNSTFCSNLATVYGTTNRAKDAIAAFRDALTVSPDCVKSLTGLCQQRRAICDWIGLERDEAAVVNKLRTGANFDRVPPFALLSMPEITPSDLLRGANLWAAPYYVPPERTFKHSVARKSTKDGQRIRIGYLSADFFNHATALLIAELIEKHDRSRFEITGYSYGPDDKSPMRQRLVNAFDQFVEIRGVAHAEAAQRIYDDKIDILVDLKGYTRDARTEILAFRPAPIQVNYLGYPGTTGADFIDYIIGDPVVTPLVHQPHFSEKIVQLPHSYQPNDTQRAIAEKAPTRADCGLPEGAFVFCCFNNTYKLTQAFFTVWMHLLKAVPNSVLWLLEANNSVKENLSREAASCGVDPARLIFAQRMPVPEHLARHCHADLFLDTLPVNAHTTTSDALWAGLPVVTCAGDTFAGRVAASLLNAVELPELVASSLEEYEALTLKLATDPTLLAGLKQKLARKRLTAPLFDIERYTRNLETAYVHMVERLESGASPEAFAVADLPA